MTKLAMQLAIPTILCATALTGCGDARPVLALPPAELATCAAEPETPVLGPPGIERDRVVLEYVLALREAWGDCSAKVAGLKSWRETAAE